jgi:hypothetical protein
MHYNSARSSLYLFGGRSNHPTTNETISLNDLWQFTNSHWIELTAINELYPPGRAEFAMTTIDDLIIIYGGVDPLTGSVFDDLWIFHISKRRWGREAPTTYQAPQFLPPALFNVQAFVVPKSATKNATGFMDLEVMIYGGIGGGDEQSKAQQIYMGQLYTLSICLSTYKEGSEVIMAPHVPMAQFAVTDNVDKIPKITFIESIKSLVWNYARLSSENDVPTASMDRYGGGLVKSWGMELTCYDYKRGLLYEIGGIMEVPSHEVKGDQPRMRDYGAQNVLDGEFLGNATYHSDGKNLRLWNNLNGRPLFDSTLPANKAWHRMDFAGNATLQFSDAFRTFSVRGDGNIILEQTAK